jgi:hypothetical protein
VTGPEHYRKAEDLAERAAEDLDNGRYEHGSLLASIAQLHVGLAQAAAMVDATNEAVSDLEAWLVAQRPEAASQRQALLDGSEPIGTFGRIVRPFGPGGDLGPYVDGQ